MGNDHITKYLQYYVDLPPEPGYAVMINGPWGVGKTHYLKNVIEQFKSSGKIAFWISLYGVQSTDEIDQRLIAALTPYLVAAAHKRMADQSPVVDELVEKGAPYFQGIKPLIDVVAKYGGRIGSAVIKRTGVGGVLQASGLRNLVTPDLIVFDDLERGSMKAKDLLGYINQFIELEGRKAVILANEAEIESADNDYRKIREKVIGQTFQLREDFEPALKTFIRLMPNDDARKYIESNLGELHRILRQSKCKNLRVVRQVLLTWDRLYAAIDPALRERTEAMQLVFQLFTAICTEVRLGRLAATDLENRVFKIVSGSADSDPKNRTPLAEADEKFPELFLHDTVLTDEVLIHVICEGLVDAAEINQSLRQSSHFKAPENEPAWQKVWWGLSRDPKEFETAFASMETQFMAREFVEPGEILHVFGLRLWGAEIGQLSIAKNTVVDQCRQYVDDLAENDRLLTKVDRESFRHGAAHGLGFMFVETEEFKQLRDYFWDSVDKAKKQRWPREAEALVSLLSSDLSSFCAKIAWTNDARENTYQRVPIFSSISPSAFVQALLQLQPAEFRTALTALKERYVGDRLRGELAPERSWLLEVRDLLLGMADTEVPIRKFAIRNEANRLLSPYFNEK